MRGGPGRGFPVPWGVVAVGREPAAGRATERQGRGRLAFGWPTALALPLAVVVTARTLARFALLIADHLAIQYDLWFEIGMVVGQVLFQWAVLWRRGWPARLDYAVIVVFVSSLGAALLWPLLAWHAHAPVGVPVAVAYFFAVVPVMFAVHARLVARAGLPLVLCATWVAYRLLILAVVLRR